MKRTALGLVSAMALMGSAGPVFAADPQAIDWSKIPAKSIVLFYPGQSTYNWLTSPEPQGRAVDQAGQGVHRLPRG